MLWILVGGHAQCNVRLCLDGIWCWLHKVMDIFFLGTLVRVRLILKDKTNVFQRRADYLPWQERAGRAASILRPTQLRDLN